jgi:ABC-type multidrug transport system ATPase subunit
MFDRLMLLAQGKILYFNDAKLSVDYFGKMGFQNPELSNPADYFMSIMSIESIQKRDVDPNDTTAVASSVLEVQDKYNARIKQFDKSYQDSELKNDPNE